VKAKGSPEKGEAMTLIRVLRYAPEAVTGLCRTCTWGTVRKGFRGGEAEAFAVLLARIRAFAMRSANARTIATVV
jgi:hypothetical protein